MASSRVLMDVSKITFLLLGVIKEPTADILTKAGFSVISTGLNAYYPSLSGDIQSILTKSATIVLSDMDQVSTSVTESYDATVQFILNTMFTYSSTYIYYKLNVPCPEALAALRNREGFKAIKDNYTRYYIASLGASQFGTELFLCCDLNYKAQRPINPSYYFPAGLLPYYWVPDSVLTTVTHDPTDNVHFYNISTSDMNILANMTVGATSYVTTSDALGKNFIANIRATSDQRLLNCYYGSKRIDFSLYEFNGKPGKLPSLQMQQSHAFDAPLAFFDSVVADKLSSIARAFEARRTEGQRLVVFDMGGRDETAIPEIHEIVHAVNQRALASYGNKSMFYINVEPNPPPTARHVYLTKEDNKPVGLIYSPAQDPMNAILEHCYRYSVARSLPMKNIFFVILFRNSLPTIFPPDILRIVGGRATRFMVALEAFNYNFMQVLGGSESNISDVFSLDRHKYPNYNVFTFANYYVSTPPRPTPTLLDNSDQIHSLHVRTPSYSMLPRTPTTYRSQRTPDDVNPTTEYAQQYRQNNVFTTASYPNVNYAYEDVLFKHSRSMFSYGDAANLNRKLRRKGVLVNRTSQIHTGAISCSLLSDTTVQKGHIKLNALMNEL